jgi:adenosylhomocysteinase
MAEFLQRLDWARRQMPLTRGECEALPDLSNKRLALSIHLDLKMIPALEALLARGCGLFITSCNPATVRDEVVAYLREKGAQTYAWREMSAGDSLNAFDLTLAIMVAGLRFILSDTYRPRPGLYHLPMEVWQGLAKRALAL